MRAAALAVALVLAKCAAVAGRPLPASVWLVPALFWQDVAVAGAFWVVDRLSRRSRVMWAPYWAIAIVAAIGVPIVRVLASPLTMPMLRAAGGALRDSIVFYVTPVNVALM